MLCRRGLATTVDDALPARRRKPWSLVAFIVPTLLFGQTGHDGRIWGRVETESPAKALAEAAGMRFFSFGISEPELTRIDLRVLLLSPVDGQTWREEELLKTWISIRPDDVISGRSKQTLDVALIPFPPQPGKETTFTTKLRDSSASWSGRIPAHPAFGRMRRIGFAPSPVLREQGRYSLFGGTDPERPGAETLLVLDFTLAPKRRDPPELERLRPIDTWLQGFAGKERAALAEVTERFGLPFATGEFEAGDPRLPGPVQRALSEWKLPKCHILVYTEPAPELSLTGHYLLFRSDSKRMVSYVSFSRRGPWLECWPFAETP